MSAVYGVFGWPVSHSRSPAMHNAAFGALGLDAVYVPYAVPPARLAHAVEAARALAISGFNVTLPHKAAIMPLVSELEPAARAIGAVNTVIRDGARLIGANTDAEGLVRSLIEGGVALAGARVVVLGAGGAARAAVYGLSKAGAVRIAVAARRRSEADALVAELAPHMGTTVLASCDFARELADVFADASLVIQATSAGLGQPALAERFADSLPLVALPEAAAICDLVYKPRETALLARAKTRGLTIVGGIGMLLHQGALAFERWTGRAAPLEAMRAALG